jgi:pimeloyl-ACP methyl ester carboxylesterase
MNDRQKPEPRWLQPGETRRPYRLATLESAGAGPPILWMGGFRSDMRATKAEALAQWAQENGRRFGRFDYGGHGESGGEFAALTLSDWLDDSETVVRQLALESPVLVGSSLGGWLALLLARRLAGSKHAPSGLVLIAPAVDFTETLMWAQFPQHVRDEILTTGSWLRPTEYAPEPYSITRRLIEDGRRHLLLGAAIDPGCPVHILQGMNDPDVPWPHVMKLVEHLPQTDLTVTLIRDGDHRLSRPQDIDALIRAVAAIVSAD